CRKPTVPAPLPLSGMSLGIPASHVAPMAPCAKRTILVHEGAEHLDHERPEGDGLAEHLAAVGPSTRPASAWRSPGTRPASFIAGTESIGLSFMCSTAVACSLSLLPWQ